MASGNDALDVNESLLNGGDKFQVYSYRWVVLFLFTIASMANAIIMPTWNSITDKAETYFGIGITFINLFGVMFQVMGFPGTMVALRVAERNGLRTVILCGAVLTSCGAGLRFLGAVMKDSIGSNASYCLILLGTALVGLSQPFFVNSPAKIAAVWFGVKERDTATSICMLAIMLGVCVGSFLPPLLTAGESDGDVADGIRNLLMVQFILVSTSAVIQFLFFQNEPPTPPSETAKQGSQKMISKNAQARLGNVEDRQRTQSFTRTISVDLFTKHKTMWAEILSLLTNLEYMKLFTSFTLVAGTMHGCLALINQFPDNYGNDEVGYASSAILVSGLIGSFSIGFVMDYTKAYRTIYKITNVLSLVFLLFFLSCFRDNAYMLFLISGTMYGFCVIPTFPACIICAVECAYPIPEEACVGIMFIGMSLWGICVTFIGQVLLGLPSSHHSAPFFPFGYFLMTMAAIAVVPVLTFKGRYLRLEMDTQRESDLTRGSSGQNPLSAYVSGHDMKYVVFATDDVDDDHVHA